MIRLLIVDDEIASIRILQKFIPFEEYQLKLMGIAQNGSEALQYFNSSVLPQIVITDMNMPIMDGISFLQFLIDYHPKIKVLVISGYYDYEYTHAAIRANAYDYLLKPIARDKLLTSLKKCCEDIQNMQKIDLAQASPKIKVDFKLYQCILKYANNLNAILEHGDPKSLDHELELIYDEICRQVPNDDLYYLVHKILVESLFQYCVEKNYESMASAIPQDIQVFSWEDIWNTICGIYRQCLEQIMIQRKSANTNMIVEQTYNYIHDHYRENISLETIAELFFINKEYLARIFRKKYNMSIGQYIILLKIDDAKKQLAYSTHRINEISESLGYTDSTYFYRQFKKEVGISPGRYREIHMVDK